MVLVPMFNCDLTMPPTILEPTTQCFKPHGGVACDAVKSLGGLRGKSEKVASRIQDAKALVRDDLDFTLTRSGFN